VTGDGEEQRQVDQQQAAGDDTLVQAAVEKLRRELNTSTPAIVRSFDPATQTAVVVPVVRRLFVGADAFMDLPDLLDVPVGWPQGGGFALTVPLVPGDEVEVVFAQRCIDAWFARGGVNEPAETRFHDLSDAVVVAGLRSRPRALAAYQTDAVEVRTEDRSTVLRVEDGGIRLNLGGAAVARVGDSVQVTVQVTDLAALAAALAAALLATGCFTPSGTSPPPPAPVILSDGEVTSGSSTVTAGD
jgi:Phage protein Gp138 N-terminal domain